jgi:hypothetical protein
MLRGQDSTPRPAASRQEMEENYKVLEGRVKDALDGKAAQDKQLQALARQIEDMRVQMSKPTGNYATKDDLQELADKLQEIDRKRQDDKELILKEIGKLGRTLTASQTTRATTPKTNSSTDPVASPNSKADEGYWYTIKPNDTFMKIAKYYREQGIKVTSEDIAKANPNVQETKLIVDNKLFIPAPKAPQTAKQ